MKAAPLGALVVSVAMLGHEEAGAVVYTLGLHGSVAFTELDAPWNGTVTVETAESGDGTFRPTSVAMASLPMTFSGLNVYTDFACCTVTVQGGQVISLDGAVSTGEPPVLVGIRFGGLSAFYSRPCYRCDSVFGSAALAPAVLSPAPEPETYAMLLAGLALIGSRIRYRLQAEEAQRVLRRVRPRRWVRPVLGVLRHHALVERAVDVDDLRRLGGEGGHDDEGEEEHHLPPAKHQCNQVAKPTAPTTAPKRQPAQKAMSTYILRAAAKAIAMRKPLAQA
jgi:hypothetical protein